MRFFYMLLMILMLMQTRAQQNDRYSKGNFYFYWGYNRSAFTNSAITFTGNNYNFTLYNVQAIDKPSQFSFKEYFGASSFTVPQYTYRMGYFVRDGWCLSLGMDHMKYVMQAYQTVAITGQINEDNNPYNGTYQTGDQIVLTPEFLQFEHTDGLNFLNFSLDRYLKLYTTPRHQFMLSIYTGAGFGLVIPKSNVTLMNGERNDEFHLAGYGFQGNAGLEMLFFKHAFLRMGAKGGFIHLPDILTRPNDAPDRAKQHFWYGMADFAIGWQWAF